MTSSLLLNIKDLSLNYGDLPICQDIQLSLGSGEILGLAGASGSGKTSLLKAIIHPQAYGVHISQGEILYQEQDITHLSGPQRAPLLGKGMGMIFQNPRASFNPLRTYKKQFKESPRSHGLWKGEESIQDILNLFEYLGLQEGPIILESRPYEMSGGMNQRIAIALALLLRPQLLLADEPTSALDVTSQNQVMDLFKKIQSNYHLSMILVSHDLCLLAQICDRIAVMEKGHIVEEETTGNLLAHPKKAYTKELFSAIPMVGGGQV